MTTLHKAVPFILLLFMGLTAFSQDSSASDESRRALIFDFDSTQVLVSLKDLTSQLTHAHKEQGDLNRFFSEEDTLTMNGAVFQTASMTLHPMDLRLELCSLLVHNKAIVHFRGELISSYKTKKKVIRYGRKKVRVYYEVGAPKSKKAVLSLTTYFRTVCLKWL